MLIDGKQIRDEILRDLAQSVATTAHTPTLAIVVVGEDPVIESFVRIKKKTAEKLGIFMREEREGLEATTDTLVERIKRLSADDTIDGIIVQLPLPPSVNAERVLNAVPVFKDIDMLSAEAVLDFRSMKAPILPPVVGAIKEILDRGRVSVVGKDVLILGHGRLVGRPAELFFRHNGAHVTVIDKPIERLSDITREADVIISGTGTPGLVTPEMLKPGVVFIDAGTSEQGGRIVGDAAPACASVASLFTPVPGGVGPIAIAMIFRNLLVLAGRRRSDAIDFRHVTHGL
jgi:methylenetetrahydrofolate dehydrogenase (NADP+)/methenyltetrahydrofolate cyclohydrolase